MVKGLVSTIIPVFNRPLMLAEAVESVLAQTYRPIEIIIVDDGSTDSTANSADKLQKNHPGEIRVIHKKNTGPGLSRETGRQNARGEFIQYLDSDDLLLPSKFEIQVKGLIDNSECDVAYGKTRYRHRNGVAENKAWKESGLVREYMFPSFLVSRWWDTPTPLYRRGICDKAGAWTNLRVEEDWEYDCRIASLGVKLFYCNQFVAEVRDHYGERLCRGKALDAKKLAERARAHEMIFHHAINARIPNVTPEMQLFARSLFFLSRQCGATGLVKESKFLFELSIEASGEKRAKGWDYRFYKLGSSFFGWTTMGKLSCYLDMIRP